MKCIGYCGNWNIEFQERLQLLPVNVFPWPLFGPEGENIIPGLMHWFFHATTLQYIPYIPSITYITTYHSSQMN